MLPAYDHVDQSWIMAVREEGLTLVFELDPQSKKERRKSQGIIFGASEKEIFEINVNRLEDLATASFHMGTDFEAPLAWAEDKLREMPKADFLFITDGICNLSPERRAAFATTKNRSGAKCYSVLIGSEATETVRQFSDTVFCLPLTPSAREGGRYWPSSE